MTFKLFALVTMLVALQPASALAQSHLLRGYSNSGSGVNASVSSNFTNNGSTFGGGDLLPTRGAAGRIAIDTSCCSIDAPHRAAHRRKVKKRQAEANRLANLPPPCGNYSRAPEACKQ